MLYMKVKRMEITEIFRRICLFSANKIKSSESGSKQPIAAHDCHIGVLLLTRVGKGPKIELFLWLEKVAKQLIRYLLFIATG